MSNYHKFTQHQSQVNSIKNSDSLENVNFINKPKKFNFGAGFTKIDRVLSQTSKTYKLDAAITRHQILKHWQSVVAGFFETGSEETKAVDFKKGVLFIACLSKEIAYRIKVLASRIIYALNQVLGKELVFALNIEV